MDETRPESDVRTVEDTMTVRNSTAMEKDSEILGLSRNSKRTNGTKGLSGSVEKPPVSLVPSEKILEVLVRLVYP